MVKVASLPDTCGRDHKVSGGNGNGQHTRGLVTGILDRDRQRLGYRGALLCFGKRMAGRGDGKPVEGPAGGFIAREGPQTEDGAVVDDGAVVVKRAADCQSHARTDGKGLTLWDGERTACGDLRIMRQGDVAVQAALHVRVHRSL